MGRGVYRRAGCRRKYSRREMLNSIFYVIRTGCQWTDLPHDFSPWKSVYSQFLRWIVERTFAWLGKCRCLSKDYELMTKSSLSMLYLGMIRLVLRRIAKIC